MVVCYVFWFGYSAAFPLLIKTQFPGVNFGMLLGPMCGPIRPLGGWVRC
jgi:NNP family nitrate/nitrite transporter-like MFS transporter